MTKHSIQYTDAEGWLSPNGKMFYGPHVDVACRFYGDTDDPHGRMDKAGWWRIRSQMRNAPEWSGLLPATPQQRQYIVRWVRGRNDRHSLRHQAELPPFHGVDAELARVLRIMSA